MDKYITGQEIWKGIPGWEYYEASNLGRIRSLDRYPFYKDNRKRFLKGRILKATANNRGYYYVTLCEDGVKNKKELVHRLVATTFLHNPEKKRQINHIDGHPKNNHVSNLEWCSNIENSQHAWDNNYYPRGEKHYSAKITDDEALEIRNLYAKKTFKQKELAKMYGVSKSNISAIVLRKSFKHI